MDHLPLPIPTVFVVTIFVATYVGMAVGRIPGLRVDRTGIALIAAILLFGTGGIGQDRIVEAIDFPTLIILFGLMILSAQFAASGFYDWASMRIATSKGSPATILGIVVVVAGTLSAVLANDVVVFAMTPLLCLGIRGRGLDPRPYLIALAGAANAGSAATIIGNPQNIVIGQVGDLGFWHFLAVCGPPAVVALALVHATVWLIWRNRLHLAEPDMTPLPEVKLDRAHFAKALVATALLLASFGTPLPDETGVLLIAGFILFSRRLTSRHMLGMVDWQLLVLFVCLFVVTDALAQTGLPAEAVDWLAAKGLLPESLAVLAPLTLIASNTIGNVPTVVLLLSIWPELPSGPLYALALLSTLAGNLMIVGSLANIIVVERAQHVGVSLGFREHARCGIPMTLASFVVALAWLWLTGLMPAI